MSTTKRHDQAVGVAEALADFQRRVGTLNHAEAMQMIRTIDDLVGTYDTRDANRLIWPHDIAIVAGMASRRPRQETI